MIAALDVHYDDRTAGATGAAVLFEAWADAQSHSEHVVRTGGVAPYEPGAFYKRELPCLLAVLKSLPAAPSIVAIDGYVTLGDKPGLGTHLWEALERRTPIIGVAKTRFHSAAAKEVLRGGSLSPLYVTAVGIDLDEAAAHIQAMVGPHRIPTLLKRVDQLARGR
jgi:deoxyribonuclease V